MGSKTKIVVLHMKEIVYTLIFAALGILLIILLVIMFRFGHSSTPTASARLYTPGIYTSSLTLNNTNLEVEVTVDESQIKAIRLSNLDESTAAMFPLLQPAIENIADQVCKTQSTDNITLSSETPYKSSWMQLMKPLKKPQSIRLQLFCGSFYSFFSYKIFLNLV